MCSNVKVCGPTKFKVCNKSNESYKTALPVLMFLSQFFPSRTFGKLIFLPTILEVKGKLWSFQFPSSVRAQDKQNQ